MNFLNVARDICFAPWNSIDLKSLIETITKFNVDRRKFRTVKKCACCGEEIGAYLPFPRSFIDTLKSHGFNTDGRYEMLSLSEYTCPNCGSADRERAYALVMKKLLAPSRKIRILDIAPRQCITNFVKNNFPAADYKTGDLFMPDVDYRLNITDMRQISDASVDFFICSHVLEHVADDIAAMRELKRILNPSGCGIAVVPIDLDRTDIDEDPNCTDVNERWRRFGQDDHVRAYSKRGYIERLKQVGFAVEECGRNFWGEDEMRANGLTATSVVYVVRREDN